MFETFGEIVKKYCSYNDYIFSSFLEVSLSNLLADYSSKFRFLSKKTELCFSPVNNNRVSIFAVTVIVIEIEM